MAEKTGFPRLIVVQTDQSEALFLERICEEINARGYRLSRLPIESDALDGSASAVERLLEQVRGLRSPEDPEEGGAVVMGVGLGANLALEMSTLDRAIPRRKQFGRQTVIYPGQLERHPVLAGVIAISPFLGFDFSISRGPCPSSEQFDQWRLDRCRGSGFLARLLGGLQVSKAADRGMAGIPAPTWRQLARVLPFASVTKLLPSLKTGTAFLLDLGPRSADISMLLGALNAKVTVMDTPMEFPALGHATLAVIDRFAGGSEGIHG